MYRWWFTKTQYTSQCSSSGLLTFVDLERVRNVRRVVDAESDHEDEVGGGHDVDLDVPPIITIINIIIC